MLFFKELTTVICFSSSSSATSLMMFPTSTLMSTRSMSIMLAASSMRVSTEMSRNNRLKRLLCA